MLHLTMTDDMSEQKKKKKERGARVLGGVDASGQKSGNVIGLRLYLSTNDYISAAGSHKVTQQKRRRTTGGVLGVCGRDVCRYLRLRSAQNLMNVEEDAKRSPHLREFLVFIRETVHRVVEHLLHQTLLLICKHCETLKCQI